MACQTPLVSDPEAASIREPIDVEKLGRQRPPVFSTAWAELGFMVALLDSMAMAEFFVSGFHIILPPLAIELDIPEASRTWPSSVFALATGAFLLLLGRVSDMYGAYVVFASGLAWFCLWCLVAGFSQNYMTLIICRALQGLGSAVYLTGGIALLGKIYRPGPRKNLVFALYGAFALLGFFIGILMGGVAGEFLLWRWYFWLGSIILAVICCFAILCVLQDFRRHPPPVVSMDWWGASTIVPGLILVAYAITDSSHAPNGWASPQIIVIVITGVLLLATTIYLEGWVIKDPLVPADFFSPAYMKPLLVASFFAYGSYGVFLFYTSFYIELVLHKSPLQTALWYVPLIVGGLTLATVGGFTLHKLPGRLLLIISGFGYVVSCLLFALMPDNPNYWAWVMPAMVASTIGIDITFTISNVFITTNLTAKRQGLAGGLVHSVVFLGISVMLGFADVAVNQVSHLDLKQSYQVAFWSGVGVSAVALLIFAFLDVGRAKSDLTVEERGRMNDMG